MTGSAAAARPTVARVSRMATLVHPGPVAKERVVCVPTHLTPHEFILPAGTPLLAALEALLRQTDSIAASGELVGGELEQYSYFIPDLGHDGGPAADFSPPIIGQGPARLIRGGLTVGHRSGSVFAHSHALFADTDGVERAGHLIPDSVVLGPGVRARVWCTAEVAIESEPDPETGMTLFTPRQVANTGSGEIPAIVCRVRPNVDLVGMVEALTEQQGWTGAEVRGQIGSLVGAKLEQADGSVLEVDGPATEVMFLDGFARHVDGRVRADLTAHLVDRYGTVHRGRLLPGQNSVAMTYELVLTEAPSPRLPTL